MILEIPGFLTQPEVQHLQQIDHAAPRYQESTQLLMQAPVRHEGFRDFAMPLKIAPPLMCKYGTGMSYGAHSDVAVLPLARLQTTLRSDVSATVFLQDPDTYDGGELVLHLESRKVPIKLPAGGMVVYPSTMLHEVAEVTRGQRLVAITFIESRIIDERQRYIIYSLGEVSALEGLTMKPENRNRLDLARHNLIRMWS